MIDSMEGMRQYNSIDVGKFVAALCVVTIHTSYFDGIENRIVREPLIALISCAVPFFFIVSGYFVVRMAFCGDDEGKGWKNVVLHYGWRMLRLYLIWCVVNMYYLYPIIHTPVWESLKDMLFCGYRHLWYMWGVLLVMPIVCWLVHKGVRSWMFIVLGVGTFCFNRVFTHYGSMSDVDGFWRWCVVLYEWNFKGVTNVCLAITYLSMGAFFAISEVKVTRWICVVLIMVGFVMMHFEMRSAAVALGVPVMVFGLFPLVRDWKVEGGRMPFMLMRSMSATVYFVHEMVIFTFLYFGVSMCFTSWLSILAVCVLLAGIREGIRWHPF